jgi:hypothetical protein
MTNRPTLTEIADIVCAVTGLDIRLRTRKEDYVFGRMIYAKIARENTIQNLNHIGKEVGVKHDTVIYYISEFDKIIDTGCNIKIYDCVLAELGIVKEVKEEVVTTDLNLLQLKVLSDLKQLSHSELSEFYETRLKPFKKALESRVMPKVIIEEQGAMLNK